MRGSAKETVTTYLTSVGRTAVARGFMLLCALAALVGLQASTALALPSDRAYEMVSPPEKNGADMGAGTTPGGFRASADGNQIAYTATAGFGDVQSHTIATGYQAARGEDVWSSVPTALPMAPLTAITYMGPLRVSEDLSKTVVQTNLNLETGEELPAGTPYAWYLYDPITKEKERLTPPAPDGSNYELDKGSGFEIIDGSHDFSTVYLTAMGTLTDDAAGLDGNALYRYSDGDLELVSVLPDDTPVTGVLAGGPYADIGQGTTSRQWASRNGVSKNGDTVYWSRQVPTPPDWAAPAQKAELYRTVYAEDGTAEVELVNASENTLESVPVGSAFFFGASEDGTIAFFRSAQKLVDEDTDEVNDIYQWDSTKAPGSRLTLVSAGGLPQRPAEYAVGASNDGKRIYFEHRGSLVPEAPVDPGFGDELKKLYVWDDGEIHYIAPRESYSSPGDFGAGTNYTAFASSPDGSYLTFAISAVGLTPDNLNSRRQVFVYDLENDEVSCASCVGTGVGNTQPAQLWQGSLSFVALYPGNRRNVSNDGTVFFDTVESLLPTKDTNGKRDVYMWKDGQTDLVSSGRGVSDSFFTDASEDGSSVFFYTFDRLVGWDVDHNSDLYAARVGGGFPEPKPETPCTGSGCQEPPTAPPTADDPGSSNYQGGGNAKPGCDALSGEAKKAAKKARKLQRKARSLKKKGSKKRVKQVRKKAKRAKKAQRAAERQLDRCEEGSR